MPKVSAYFWIEFIWAVSAITRTTISPFKMIFFCKKPDNPQGLGKNLPLKLTLTSCCISKVIIIQVYTLILI